MSETKYLETHEWYIVDGDNVTVGISDYAQGELGDIVFVTLPEVGQESVSYTHLTLPTSLAV